MTTLREQREKIGLTTRQIAAHVGIHQSQYTRVETGKHRASPELANRLAKFFDNAITRDQILFPEDYVPGVKKRPRSVPGKKPVRNNQLQEAR